MIVELCIIIVGGTLRRLFASYLLPHTDLTDLAENFLSDESEFLHKINP